MTTRSTAKSAAPEKRSAAAKSARPKPIRKSVSAQAAKTRSAGARTSRGRAAEGRTAERGAGKIGFVSLGCPKALVDSERILTRLRAEGYEVSPTYAAAD